MGGGRLGNLSVNWR